MKNLFRFSRKSDLWQEIKKYRVAYLWISPFFILFLVFQLYPFLYSFVLTAYRWTGIGPKKFVGIKNFIYLFNDDLFWKTLGNSFFLWVLIVPIRTFLALVLAVIFISPRVKGKQFFRVVYILPFVTSMILISLIFRVLLEYHGGWVNVALNTIGIPPIGWLRDVRLTKISLSLVIMWRTLGYFMIIMLAGLQRIPRDLYEAAQVDGASVVQSFFRITIPLMKPIISFVLIISIIQVLQTFEEPFVMTQGGPIHSSTTIIYLLWIEAFQYNRLGYASSIAVVLFFIIAVISIAQVKLLQEQE